MKVHVIKALDKKTVEVCWANTQGETGYVFARIKGPHGGSSYLGEIMILLADLKRVVAELEAEQG